jgi:hypothetical protein
MNGLTNMTKTCHCGLDPQSPGKPRVGAGRALPLPSPLSRRDSTLLTVGGAQRNLRRRRCTQRLYGGQGRYMLLGGDAARNVSTAGRYITNNSNNNHQ